MLKYPLVQLPICLLVMNRELTVYQSVCWFVSSASLFTGLLFKYSNSLVLKNQPCFTKMHSHTAYFPFSLLHRPISVACKWWISHPVIMYKIFFKCYHFLIVLPNKPDALRAQHYLEYNCGPRSFIFGAFFNTECDWDELLLKKGGGICSLKLVYKSNF